jgi:hypothetical protein
MPDKVPAERLRSLDATFALSERGNSEILAAWLQVGIRNGYEPALQSTERFLLRVGRRKFLKPLYEELAKTEAGKSRARAVYVQARPRYHSVSVRTIDQILGWPW